MSSRSASNQARARALRASSVARLETTEARSEGVFIDASVRVHFLGQPHLDQRLVGYVPLVGRNLDALEQVLQQTQRNGSGRQLQIGETDTLRLAPVKVLRRIVTFPKFAFVRFTPKLWDRLKLLLHRSLSLFDSCPVPKSREPSIDRAAR